MGPIAILRPEKGLQLLSGHRGAHNYYQVRDGPTTILRPELRPTTILRPERGPTAILRSDMGPTAILIKGSTDKKRLRNH